MEIEDTRPLLQFMRGEMLAHAIAIRALTRANPNVGSQLKGWAEHFRMDDQYDALTIDEQAGFDSAIKAMT